jgi:hypothetical protein
MPTYSNDLRLKEISTGGEDGTWGTSTNTNLSLIADAFGYGTKQLAADANETFTMPDATADGTRALYLKITSAVSLSATRTVTLGPNTVSKVWIIENATTGGQSITISQGSGSTVTIANSAKAMVYTDGAGAGAAVVSANPTAATVDLSTGVTGTLAATNGGTGQASYAVGDLLYASTTTALSKLADVATGNALISGGVGTAPSWGKIDLTTHVSGTLPVANGGTGQTTYTDGQLLIGNTTGNTLTKATLTAGSGITITNGTGSITIASSLAVGALVYLSSVTAASSSTVDLETGFGASYDNYVVIGDNVLLAGADQLCFRLKIGGTYISTATYYNSQDNTSSATAASVFTLTPSSLAGPYSFVVNVFSANASAQKMAQSRTTTYQSSPSVYGSDYSHLNTNTGVVSGVRFLCSGANAIASGTFYLYGIAKS